MIKENNYSKVLVFFSTLLFIVGCDQSKEKDNLQTMTVTATAYNSVESQTKKGNIGLAAWGDTLVPGEKSIAVSRDLIKMGLGHNAEVKINGLEGTYIVKDKMNKRWEKKIDIYMGLDEEASKEWGKKKVKIKFDTIKRSD
ncbi:3D domain-containing protein [Psychroflexus aestuariivivens]|uniref:3D domain-containing protein n=1 Tax=Psychroflexus aestuariivivens TaxID=1795040 RepID=UPI001300A04B|nr:3D domain-containing protein [Psychroflexus aestuariivivens]